jgi:hypothetical protein
MGCSRSRPCPGRSGIGRQAHRAHAGTVVALGCLFAAVIVLSLGVVAFLAPLVGGMANAAGLLSLALLGITGLSAWRIWYLATQEFGLLSVLKRWWKFAATGPGGEV